MKKLLCRYNLPTDVTKTVWTFKISKQMEGTKNGLQILCFNKLFVVFWWKRSQRFRYFCFTFKSFIHSFRYLDHLSPEVFVLVNKTKWQTQIKIQFLYLNHPWVPCKFCPDSCRLVGIYNVPCWVYQLNWRSRCGEWVWSLAAPGKKTLYGRACSIVYIQINKHDPK